MNLDEVNNFFGDLDLYLLDFLLKFDLAEGSRVLDVGCGAGRNSLYFLQNGFEVSLLDSDQQSLDLLKFAVGKQQNASFHCADIQQYEDQKGFELIVCSRVLHFAENEADFVLMIKRLKELLIVGGTLYVAMDSIIGDQFAVKSDGDLVEFAGKKQRFPLNQSRYNMLKEGLEELEPLRTVSYADERTQSFALLRKL